MQPSQTCCSGFSVRCFTPGTKVSFRNFLPTTIVTKWRMDQKGSSTFHVNFNQTLIVNIVIASFLQGDVWHGLGNVDHPRHLSNAKLWLADQKCWSVKRRPTFLWGRIHFVNRDLSTHRVCVVFIGHIGAPVKSLINWLLKQGREEPTLSVFECNGEKIFEHNFCRCTKDWRMKRC